MGKERDTMNGLVIILIGIVVLAAAYIFYGRWLARKWGIDPKAKTPAYTKEDGVDYVPSSKFTVFSHQFSSIAGAGPVTGPILASVFGWVPVLLWLLVGGIFFGAVQDFGSLYASVKNEGKSIGMIVEKYIGKIGRKLFMIFCWLFTLLVIAAFTDMVAGTFNAKGLGDGVANEQLFANASAGSISMMFIGVAIILGVIIKFTGDKLKEWMTGHIVMAYLFFASILPMWLMMQPRDYLTTFMLLGMIGGAVIGVLVAHPSMNLNAFNGFKVNDSYLFPTLFVTIACGAVSGFHSLVSSGTSSKTVSNEKDMPFIGFGAMLFESLLGIVALVVVGSVAVNGTKPDGTPFAIFSSGVAGFLEKLGVSNTIATVFMTMCVSALALTSLDSVARIGRMSFQEIFAGDSKNPLVKVLTNKYFATVITLVIGYLLAMGGYSKVWPLFGSANQLLAALVLITLSVFLKTTGRTGWTLYVPMFAMLAVTFTALVQKTIALVRAIVAHSATFLSEGLQLIIAALLMVLGICVAVGCLRKLFTAKKQEA